ncbi:hypothetical protein [Dolosigranulum pigrum]|uniref:hypothetical protein n=1 Tax=Dolosigranulum pigrum TaxID=29394 RepID=UPI00163DE1DC|nr:hypothetical protein [Dolosigranulum pigrum]
MSIKDSKHASDQAVKCDQTTNGKARKASINRTITDQNRRPSKQQTIETGDVVGS